MLSPDEFLELPIGIAAADQAARTTKGSYRDSYRYINITSYSQREALHECPRKFQQLKIQREGVGLVELTNLDFIFGHAVGAGAQTYIVTGNKNAAIFACMLSWTTDLNAEIEKKDKSCFFAILAVLKFINFWDQVKGQWEVATFAGRPAAELIFWLDCENGFYHAGHIDVVFRHKTSGHYLVIEIKTTSARNPDEAMYGNSDQGLGYSIIVDAIAGTIGGVSAFEVLYYVYSSTRREWSAFPFTKSRTMRAEWLQDLLLDHTTLNTYIKLGYFPKRGNACWSFSRRCPHYGVCDLKPNTRVDKFDVFDAKTLAYPEKPDFVFKLSDLIQGIKEPG